MRTNTLIKLLAVLAMCFIIGSALVACSANEPAEEDAAKVIAGIAFDAEGNLVITYDDETTQKVALPTPAACTHNSIAKVTIEEHTANANGTYIEICNDCGYGWVKYEQRHNWVEDSVTVDPTCTTEGYTIESYCATCGLLSEKTDVNGPIDHVWDDGEVVIDGNICVNGGEKIYTCTFDCGNTKSEPINAAPNTGIDEHHSVAAWTVTTAPTVASTGVAAGVCTVCDETVTYTLPALEKDNVLNNADYTIAENVRTSCREDATANFTLKAETSIVINNAVVEPAGEAHMLKNSAGEFVFVHATEIGPDGKPVYKYNKDDFAGIKEFADTPINSCTPTLAYYVCEAEYCDAVVDIYAYAEHAWESIGRDTIVCGVEAFEHFQCPDCLETKDESLGTREHIFKYTGLNNVSGDACNAFNYVVTCEQTDCDYNEVVDLAEADVVIDRETTPVTCEDDGKIYVSYTVPGTTTVLKYEHTVPKKGHVLNGQQMVAAVTSGDAPTADDTVYNWVEGCGIYAFDGKEINDQYAVLGYFVCDHASGTETHRVPVWVMIGGAVDIVPAP